MQLQSFLLQIEREDDGFRTTKVIVDLVNAIATFETDEYITIGMNSLIEKDLSPTQIKSFADDIDRIDIAGWDNMGMPIVMLGGTSRSIELVFSDLSSKRFKGFYTNPQGWKTLAKAIAGLFDNDRILNYI